MPALYRSGLGDVMRCATVLLCVVGAVLSWTPGSGAQSPPRIAFEVASVRVSSMDSNFRNLHRTTATRVDRVRPLDMLLMEAFRERSFYRIAAPDWANEVMVEIQATLPEGAAIQQVPEMLRTLLEERFGLVSHREARPMDAYELLVAEGGVKMKEVEPLDESEKEVHLDPVSGVPQREVSARDTPSGRVRVFQVPVGGSTRLTSRTLYERRTIHNEGSIITATRMSMAELVSELEPNVDKPIVDKTGLTRLYQFTLQLPRDEVVERLLRTLRAARGSRTSADPELTAGVSLPASLERLGLKLERRRTPVEMVVVDALSRTPTEN